jgi:hypothetical protein
MTIPDLPRYLTILSRDEIRVLRRTRRSLATAWLQDRHPDMDPEDVSQALALAPEVVTPIPVSALAPDRLRNLFIVGAWLAGASLGQLAHFYTLTDQRIRDIIHRALPGDPAMRAAMRVAVNGQPSFELMEQWHNAFYEFVKATGVEAAADMEPLEVAVILPYLPGAQPETDEEMADG